MNKFGLVFNEFVNLDDIEKNLRLNKPLNILNRFFENDNVYQIILVVVDQTPLEYEITITKIGDNYNYIIDLENENLNGTGLNKNQMRNTITGYIMDNNLDITGISSYREDGEILENYHKQEGDFFEQNHLDFGKKKVIKHSAKYYSGLDLPKLRKAGIKKSDPKFFEKLHKHSLKQKSGYHVMEKGKKITVEKWCRDYGRMFYDSECKQDLKDIGKKVFKFGNTFALELKYLQGL